MAERVLDERSVELHAAADRRVVVRRLAAAACAFAGGFILAGFSEQQTAIQLLILLPLALIARHELLWCALMGTVAGFGVVMIAPGNAYRTQALHDVGAAGLPFIAAVQMALYQTALLIGQTLVYRFYAAVPVFVVGYVIGNGKRLPRRSTWILAAFVGGFALIALSILPTLLVTGVMAYRGFTLATFILIADCALIGWLAACRVK